MQWILHYPYEATDMALRTADTSDAVGHMTMPLWRMYHSISGFHSYYTHSPILFNGCEVHTLNVVLTRQNVI